MDHSITFLYKQNVFQSFIQTILFFSSRQEVIQLWFGWLAFRTDKGSSTASCLHESAVSAGRENIQHHLIIITMTRLIMLPAPIMFCLAPRQSHTWQDRVEGMYTDINAANAPTTHFLDCVDDVFSHRHQCKYCISMYTHLNTWKHIGDPTDCLGW